MADLSNQAKEILRQFEQSASIYMLYIKEMNKICLSADFIDLKEPDFIYDDLLQLCKAEFLINDNFKFSLTRKGVSFLK